MNTSYTGHLENNLWDFAYSMDETSESDEHYEIIEYLNAKTGKHFRTDTELFFRSRIIKCDPKEIS